MASTAAAGPSRGRGVRLLFLQRGQAAAAAAWPAVGLLVQQQRQRQRAFSSSVNKDEIEKFGAYGQGWWEDDRPGPRGGGGHRRRRPSGAGPLHALNPVRVRYIAEAVTGAGAAKPEAAAAEVKKKAGAGGAGVGGVLAGYRILDVGCGGGLLSEALARLGAEVTGLDPSTANIDVARRHASVDPLTQGIRYEAVSVEEFIAADPANRRFHAVVASEVIEHVESPAAFLKALAGAVEAPTDEGDGHVLLTTINRTPKAYLIAILGAEHVTGIVPVGTHDWRKFLQPQELARFGRAAGLHVQDVSGLVYNPLTGAWRRDVGDTDVNYAMHLVKKKKQETK